MAERSPVRHVETSSAAALVRLGSFDTPCCVSVGAALGDPASDAERLRALLAAQSASGTFFPLVTARGTIASHPPSVAAWVGQHPDLRLCLDLGEWMLGCEALLGDAAEWRRLLAAIAPRVDVLVTPTGGSERVGATRSLTAPLLAAASRRRLRVPSLIAGRGSPIVLSRLPAPEPL